MVALENVTMIKIADDKRTLALDAAIGIAIFRDRSSKSWHVLRRRLPSVVRTFFYRRSEMAADNGEHNVKGAKTKLAITDRVKKRLEDR